MTQKFRGPCTPLKNKSDHLRLMGQNKIGLVSIWEFKNRRDLLPDNNEIFGDGNTDTIKMNLEYPFPNSDHVIGPKQCPIDNKPVLMTCIPNRIFAILLQFELANDGSRPR